MSRILVTVLLSIAVSSSYAAAPKPAATLAIQPEILVNGSPCLFVLQVPGDPDKVTAKWQEHDVTFAPGKGNRWYALAGVGYATKPGTYELAVDAVQDGLETHSTYPVQVRAAKYKTSRLTVPQKYVSPDPETLKRIEAEKEIKHEAFAHAIPSPEWTGNFVPPVSLQVSETYGASRTFNGKLATVHYGTDFHAPMGTPVHAANAGEIVLAQQLYYEGNCIIIDHGLGFMTLYMHLSKFDVKEGDKVEKGQEIASSGNTGRATGPHLHFAVRWKGEYLDASRLLALKLPALP
jgi:murein DD-endopeptidase MepM/ murein hydrolase activator NlpD